MADRDPIAFLSYVRSDDEHDGGKITKLRQRLEGEVRMQTGKPFEIFQDRNDIAWGQQWEQRIGESIANVTFLIPVITPSFFNSPMCRKEFDAFRLREKTLGLDRLILPIYYVECGRLENRKSGQDPIADIIAARNWADWRNYRFKPFETEETSGALAEIARQVSAALDEVYSVVAKEKEKPIQPARIEVKSIDVRPQAGEKRIDVSIDIPEVLPLVESSITNDVSRLGYYAYTKAFDEIVRADELVDPAESSKLYRLLTRRSAAILKSHAKLFQKLRETPVSNSTAITLLVDNSGSMRGKPIASVASWLLILVQWLERLQIKSEVLGFTTRAWKGGQSRERWVANNKPLFPGRLNDLRHIVYKGFSDAAISGVPSLGVMIREGVLKENIDGEAILWAYQRLRAVEAKNKALIVISDGAPVDDSTLSVNPGNYLERHLRAVIEWISADRDIYLGAVGIEHDVSRYYAKAEETKDSADLGVGATKIIDDFLNDAAS